MVVGGSRTSKLHDGSSEFSLTYEDKDGDWMLVGDVPWGYAYLCTDINVNMATNQLAKFNKSRSFAHTKQSCLSLC